MVVTDMIQSTYEGCVSCLKKSSGHSGPQRSCYNVELMVSDHNQLRSVLVHDKS